MTAQQTAGAVLAKASEYDQTFAKPVRGILAAWAEGLGDLPLEDCLQAVADHYVQSTDRLMVAHVAKRARLIYRERVVAEHNQRVLEEHRRPKLPEGQQAVRELVEEMVTGVAAGLIPLPDPEHPWDYARRYDARADDPEARAQWGRILKGCDKRLCADAIHAWYASPTTRDRRISAQEVRHAYEALIAERLEQRRREDEADLRTPHHGGPPASAWRISEIRATEIERRNRLRRRQIDDHAAAQAERAAHFKAEPAEETP